MAASAIAVTESSVAESPEVLPVSTPWPLWQRVLFRFFFIYYVLQISPWEWFGVIPGVPFLIRWSGTLVDQGVRKSNANWFHVRETLVLPNGSGDTSWAFAQMWLFIVLAVVGCIVWSVLDRRRTNYNRLLYWFRLVVRYWLASVALSYGIIKLFALQMPFPSLSQLATPLGDLLPMRFSWLFIGYSFRYQFFSGAMETVAGLLLLNRSTVTLGLFAAVGAFLNVFMINVSYDVPVKLFSGHLLFASAMMLAMDAKRLVPFLVLNRAAPATRAYDPPSGPSWQRWAGYGVKLFLLWQILLQPLQSGWNRYKAANAPVSQVPFRQGVYSVRSFVVNADTIPATRGDTLRWSDVIIDGPAAGSVNTRDAVFWRRYGRGYFRYKADTAAHSMVVWKTSTIPRDSTFLFTMRFEVPDTSVIRFHTRIRDDSIHVELVRVPRHFQLAEKQFHWLSEYNR